MRKKFLILCLVLGTTLTLPASTLSHTDPPGSPPGNVGTYPYNPGGAGGDHTIVVCLDSSFYQGNNWLTVDTGGRARIWEAMQTWHNVNGEQALVRGGPGGQYACPGQLYRVMIYVKNSTLWPFRPNDICEGAVMCAQQNQAYVPITDGQEHWPGAFPVTATNNKSLYINDTFYFYVGLGTPPANHYDFRSAILHELGHNLGLTHMPCTGYPNSQVMCPTLLKQEIRRTLSTHDIYHLQFLYKWQGGGSVGHQHQ